MPKKRKDIQSHIPNAHLPFMGQSLAIETEMAMEALSNYLSDLSLLQSGVSAKELYEGRKEATVPKLVSVSAGGDIETKPFTKENIQGRSGQFAHFTLSGVMRMEDGLCSYGVSRLVDNFRTANADLNISGILLEVNSGGGEVTAGQALFTAVKESKKPVVAFVHNAGSGALMGILHADRIIMGGNNARIGSIGVFTAYSKYMVSYMRHNIGFVYSDTSPDKNAAERSLIADNDTSLLKKSVNHTDMLFEREVTKARTLKGDEDMQRDTLNGGFFFAADGVKRGLADTIGTFQTAVKALESEVRTANTIKANSNSNSTNMGLKEKVIAFLNSEDAREKETNKENTENQEVSLADVMTKLEGIEAKMDAVETNVKAVETAATETATAIDEANQKIANIEASLEDLEAKQTELETNQKDIEGKKVGEKSSPVAKKNNGIAEESATEKAFNTKRKSFRAQMPEAA